MLAARCGARARLLLGPRDVRHLAAAGLLALAPALLGSGLAGLLSLSPALLGSRLALLAAALAGRRLLPASYVSRASRLAGFTGRLAS